MAGLDQLPDLAFAGVFLGAAGGGQLVGGGDIMGCCWRFDKLRGRGGDRLGFGKLGLDRLGQRDGRGAVEGQQFACDTFDGAAGDAVKAAVNAFADLAGVEVGQGIVQGGGNGAGHFMVDGAQLAAALGFGEEGGGEAEADLADDGDAVTQQVGPEAVEVGGIFGALQGAADEGQQAADDGQHAEGVLFGLPVDLGEGDGDHDHGGAEGEGEGAGTVDGGGAGGGGGDDAGGADWAGGFIDGVG